jgi:hypothetical protein
MSIYLWALRGTCISAAAIGLFFLGFRIGRRRQESEDAAEIRAFAERTRRLA